MLSIKYRFIAVMMVLAMADAARPLADTPLISISGSDLPGQFHGVMPEGIDLSPDNGRAAVVFEVGESSHTIGIWIGTWDLKTKQLLKSARIDGPFTHDELSNPQYVRSVRFASDKALVVLTGPRIWVVNAATLTPIFSIQPSKIPASRYGEALRSFDVSQDGKRLAALTAGIYDAGEDGRVAVKVTDLIEGRTLAEWTLSGRSRHISFSPNGSRVVLDRTGAAGEFSLFESASGKEVRRFTNGFGPSFGAGNAVFVDDVSIAALPEIGTDAMGRFFGKGLRVFDLNTGGVTKVMDCGKFGSTSSLAVAGRKRLVATVNAYQTPDEVRADTSVKKSKPKLLLFDLDVGTCLSIKEVPHGQFKSTVDQYSLRLSQDGSLVALFEEASAKVYQLPRLVREK